MGFARKQRSTIKDVAQLAGVSEATVSNVLRGRSKFSDNTREKVQEAIRRLDYVPQAAARNLRRRRTHTVAVLFPIMEGPGRLADNPFYWELVTAVESEGRQWGYRVLISQTEPDDDLSFVIEHNLDGVVILGAYEDYPVLTRAQHVGIPVVLVDSYVAQDFMQVRIDDYRGGYLATKHLIDLGHRRIAMVTGTRKERGVHSQRYLGYRDALREASIEPVSPWVLEGPVSFEGGKRMAEHLFALPEKPTAIFASADNLAYGLLMAARDHGVSVPAQLSVIGFDDLPLSQFLAPALTTIRQDTRRKGEEAMRLIVGAYSPAGVTQKLVEVGMDLIVRESTTPLDNAGPDAQPAVMASEEFKRR